MTKEPSLMYAEMGVNNLNEELRSIPLNAVITELAWYAPVLIR